jgi:CHASE2 domain-containing sensor protein
VLLERCLAWEPDRRLESAGKLADDLGRYCAGQRIKTKRVWLPYRLKRLVVGAAARSRWMFWVFFVAVAGLLLTAATFLLGVGWHVTGHEYHAQESAAAAPAFADRGHADIVIAGVFEDTIDAVVEFAAGHGLTGVTANLLTWRSVHGVLMERLARVDPRAVVWDYYFRTPQSGDSGLVAGIRQLEERGVPVAIAAYSYSPEATPELSPDIVGPLDRQLRHGAIVARDMVQRPGQFVLAIKRDDGSILPALALTTLAAVLHPGTQVDVHWPGREPWIELLYEIQPGAYLRERDRVELSRVFKSGLSQHAVRKGDLLACRRLTLATPEYWEQRTVPYQTLLTCPENELREWAAGKIVLVGDLRASKPGFVADRHTVQAGDTIIQDMPGVYLMADAITSLLDRQYVRLAFPLPFPTLLVMLVVAGVGCLVPVRLAAVRVFEKRSPRHAVQIALWAAAGASLLGAAATRDYAGVHLGLVSFALLMPMAGSFWIEFARNRHLQLDRARSARNPTQAG